MVDTGRIPLLCGNAFESLEVSSGCALEDRLAGLSIGVDCRRVPVSGRDGWERLIVDVVVLGSYHELDISDCIVIEQISMHVAIVLHVAGKQLAYSRCMHWLGKETRCD